MGRQKPPAYPRSSLAQAGSCGQIGMRATMLVRQRLDFQVSARRALSLDLRVRAKDGQR